ncbi:Plus3 domain-containing protein [Abeliophyllum distichum]|uniref:Plus3 domain-containing protein n=1 Tax=Abeliophyllum distichum TaxID=126358 RepID=A0ABD1PER5_9LAMI
MSSEIGSDSGKEGVSWGRGQEEEEASSGRLVEGIDEDEVLSPAPLTAVPPRVSSTVQAGTRGERVVESGTIGRREAEVASGLRTAPIWKCRFFPSEVSEGQLREWHQMYRIPDDIEFVVPGPDDRADDPPLGTVALNQAILAAGLRLPFPRVVRKFLREWGIAPTQLCPNGWRILVGLLVLWDQLGFPRPSIGDFYSLYSFKSDGKRSGWWYASVKARTGGSVVTQTPDSIKNWKKFWFFVRGPWQFAEDDARPDLSIPVRYHELRYVAREPTEESAERARRVREIAANLRSSAVLITEENLISARLSHPLLDRPTAHRPGGTMRDISALLRKKNQGPIQAGKGKRKVPTGDQDRSSRPRLEPDLPSRPQRSPARSVEEITAPVPTRTVPSSSRPPAGPQLQPTYLGSTAEKDEEFLRLRGTLPKPVRDFLRSNSPTREEIAGLPLSSRRAIRSVAKCWTPVQQKYLDSMGVVDSVVAASVNVSRAAIQLTSASEKMARLVSEVQVMRDEGRKVLEELENEKRLRAASEDILLRREEELNAKTDELERAVISRADLEADLEAERKKNSELTAALQNSTAKEEAVAEFRSSDTYLAEQEVVYFLTMEELIESTSEKRPDWDLQFLKDELADLKKKSTLNPPSPEEADPDQSGGDQDQAGGRGMSSIL